MTGSPKLGGIALVIGSILLLAGNILHPRVGTILNPVQPTGADVLARLITGNIGQHYLAHVTLIFIGPFWMLGFLTLYGVLTQQNERRFALPAILLLALFTVLLTIAGIMHGVVDPVLARNYLNAATASREIAGEILEYSDILTVTVGATAFLTFWISSILLGASMVRTRVYNKVLAWIGIVLGLVGVVGYIAGIFGPYLFFSPLFAPYAIVFSIWVLTLGVFLYRGR